MIHSHCKTRVRYAETDRMDVVHHANYLIWFEAARIQMLDEIGMPYKQMEADGFLIPVLGAQVSYKRPAYFDDRLDVHLYMRERPRARFSFQYEVLRDDQLLALGETTHGFMDRAGRGIRPPQAFIELIDRFWSDGLSSSPQE